MSYYDPLYPAYEATRFQIQRTIVDLQEKLRRRKQMDLRMEQDLIERQAIQKQRQLISYDYVANARAQDNLRQSLRRLRHFEVRPDIIGSYNIPALHREREQIELSYAHRLDALRRERQMLHRDSGNGFRSEGVHRRFVEEDSADTLVKKYQDGSKLHQYYRQLEASNEKSHREENYQSQITRNRDINQFQKSAEDFRTPFDKLRKNQTQQKNEMNNHNNNNFQVQSSKSKKKLYADNQIPSEKIESRTGSQSGRKSQRGSISPARSRKATKNQKSRQVERSRLDRSRGSNIEQDALKKIQNRLIVSSVIYEDSQYRNQKHEMTHLISTYENELKMRKQIKDKINTHPSILKKHAMVTD